MAFIKQKERKSLIKKINQSYGFRKFIISLEIIALIGFIVLSFLSFYYTSQESTKAKWEWIDSNKKITRMGIGMLVYACLITLFGLISLILTFSIKSPKTVKGEMNKLQSSALSGKRVRATESNQDVNRSRTGVKSKK